MHFTLIYRIETGRNMTNRIYVNEKGLLKYITNIFIACGLKPKESRMAAEVLHYADVNAIETHGAINLPSIYVPQLKEKKINASARVDILKDHGAIAVVDGNRGLGLYVAQEAMSLAIEKADQYGVGCVTVRRSTHFGAAGFYACQAMTQNKIGIALTNLGNQAVVHPLGSKHPLVGTNPISLAAPADSQPPFILDMSSTVCSSGRIKKASRYKEVVPEGWLHDSSNRWTTNPDDYLNKTAYLSLLGGRNDTGGFKGFGLALLVDILCGILAGAGIGPNDSNLNGQLCEDRNVGHFFLAINISAFRSIEKFKLDLDKMLRTIISCQTHSNFTALSYPGLPENSSKEVRLKNGIPFEETVFEQLCALANTFSIQQPSIQNNELME